MTEPAPRVDGTDGRAGGRSGRRIGRRRSDDHRERSDQVLRSVRALDGVDLHAFSWVFAFLGLLVSSPEAANSVGFIAVLSLTFISSAFVPVASMPALLRDFAQVNPFTVTIDAIRSLWLGTPAGNNVWGAVVRALVILVVFSPLAVARYRRAAGG